MHRKNSRLRPKHRSLQKSRRRRSLCITIPIGVLVAVCDELIQLSSEGRSCEVRDVLIDSSGILLGASIVMLILTVILRRRKVKQ